jgi:hypothetical protein
VLYPKSVAFCYQWVLDKVEEMQGKKIEILHIVSGVLKINCLTGS